MQDAIPRLNRSIEQPVEMEDALGLIVTIAPATSQPSL
jgi:hypothetical protein